MDFVNEQDARPVRRFQFFDEPFDAFLELPAVFRPGEKGTRVEGPYPLSREGFGNLPGHYPQCDSFDDRGLSDSWLPYEHGVVFRFPRKDSDHAVGLVVAADYRVEFSLLGEGRKVGGVRFENGAS